MRSLRLRLLAGAALFCAGCALIGDLSRYEIVDDGVGGGVGGGACVDSELLASCANGIDDDCDGTIDCNDDECQNQTCEQLGATCGTVAHPCVGSLMLPCGGEKNGSETDVDCGGDPAACANKCAEGQACMVNEDCASLICTAGVCAAPQCGDAQTTGGEECDEGEGLGSAISWDDSCTAGCLLNVTHLLISEVAEENDDAEFIEIYNPSATVYPLDDVYLSNWPDYGDPGIWDVPASGRWVIRFPSGATLAPFSFTAVSLQSASKFEAAYPGWFVDYDLAGEAPARMVMPDGTTPADAAYKLGDNSMVVLFEYAPSDDLVRDHDYILWGPSPTGEAMYKEGQTVGASTYMPELPAAQQKPIQIKIGSGESLYRCDPAEQSEDHDGSNGVDGHDETSENFAFAFRQTTNPTPGMAPAAPENGICPPR